MCLESRPIPKNLQKSYTYYIYQYICWKRDPKKEVISDGGKFIHILKLDGVAQIITYPPPLCTVGWLAKTEIYVLANQVIFLAWENLCNF